MQCEPVSSRVDRRRTRSSRHGAGLCVILSIFALGAEGAFGQGQRPTAERELEWRRAEPLALAVERHVLPELHLVLWLPPGSEVVLRQGRLNVLALPTEPPAWVSVNGGQAEVGLTTESLAQGLLDSLRTEGLLRAPWSSRSLTVAGSRAVEVTYRREHQDGTLDMRQALWVEEGDRWTTLAVYGLAGASAELDAIQKAVLRDATLLGDEIWGERLEALREELVASKDRALSAAHMAERNRLLEDLSLPTGIGSEALPSDLEELTERSPVYALDGLAHPHPRVRWRSIEALAGAVADVDQLATIFDRALADPDPAVRWHAARAVERTPVDELQLAHRLMSTATDSSLAGAFQLLWVTRSDLRSEFLTRALALDSGLPHGALRLCLAMVRDAGPTVADESLLPYLAAEPDADGLWHAALWTLLARESPRALEIAWRVFDRPGEDHPLSISIALRALGALPAESADLHRWRRSVERLDGVLATDELPAWRRGLLVTSREQVEALVTHIDGLRRGTGSLVEEKRALHALLCREPTLGWARERFIRIGGEPLADVESVELAETRIESPAAVALSLASFVNRLEFVDPRDAAVWSNLAEALSFGVASGHPDPLFSRADVERTTGLDLTRPWVIRQRHGTEPRAWSWSGEAHTLANMHLGVSTRDREQLQRFLLRSTIGDAAPSLIVEFPASLAAVLPFAPVGLIGLWEEARTRELGEDDAPEPARELLVSAWGNRSSEGQCLRRIELFADHTPVADETWCCARGDRLWWGQNPVLPPESSAAPAREFAGADVEMVLHADAQFRQADVSRDWQLALDQLLEGTRVRFQTRLGGQSIRCDLSVEGLSPGLEQALVEGLAAPTALPPWLPVESIAWAGSRLRKEGALDFSRWLLAEFGDLVEEPARALVTAFGETLSGDIGIALLALPDPSSVEPERAWLEQLVVWAEVDVARLGKRLDALDAESETREELRFWMFGDWALTLREGLVIISRRPESLLAISRSIRSASKAGETAEAVPASASLEARERIRTALGKQPKDALVRLFFDTDAFADQLLPFTAAEPTGMEKLGVEALRALGSPTAWLTRKGSVWTGEISLDLALRDEAPQQKVRRLTRLSRRVLGTVVIDPLPLGFDARQVTQVVFRLPLPASWGRPGATGSRRITLLEETPRGARVRLRRSAPLPQTFPMQLPVADVKLRQFLRAEQGLDVRRAEIAELAATIRGEETDPARIVRRILAWAGENLEYELVDRSTSAQTLASRSADCSEFTQLTVGLCRAIGIPARQVVGFAQSDGMLYGHAWPEVWLGRWYEFDPTWGLDYVPAGHVPLTLTEFIEWAGSTDFDLELESIENAEGMQARRLGEPPSDHAGAAPGIWASGKEVVAVFPSYHLETGAVLTSGFRSEDGGVTWRELPALPFGRVPELLLIGHGRTLVNSASSICGEALYELVDFEWKRVDLPQPVCDALAVSRLWRLTCLEDGFMLVVHAQPARVFLLDPQLQSSTEVVTPYANPAAEKLPMLVDGSWVVTLEPDGNFVAFECSRDEEGTFLQWTRIGAFAKGPVELPVYLLRVGSELWLECIRSSVSGGSDMQSSISSLQLESGEQQSFDRPDFMTTRFDWHETSGLWAVKWVGRVCWVTRSDELSLEAR